MGNMRFKVGDRVQIKSIDWYNENKTSEGCLVCGFSHINPEMINMLGKIVTISSVEGNHYRIKEYAWNWTDEMIECKVEDEIKPNIIEEAKTYWDSIKDAWICPDGYIFKDESGNIINATKIVLEKKSDDKLKLESTKKVREYWSEYARIYIEIYEDEPNECVLTHLYTLEGYRQKGYGRQALIEAESIAKELGCHTTYLKVETDSWMHQWYLRMGYKWYKNVNKEYAWLSKNLTGMEKNKKETTYPKTYEECAEIIAELTGSDCNPKGCMGYMSVQLTALQKLLICRDAYWKIAGEEMGLGKPWKPDWGSDDLKWVIICKTNAIMKTSMYNYNCILAFPTEEMRDAFKENFDPDIEICKEFL